MSRRRRAIGLSSEAGPDQAAPARPRRRRFALPNSIIVHILGWSLVALVVPFAIWLSLADQLTGVMARKQAEKLLCAQIQDVRASIVSRLRTRPLALDVDAVNRVLAQPTNAIIANARWALNVGPLVGPALNNQLFIGFGPEDGPVMQRLRNVPDMPERTRYLDPFVDKGRRFIACSEIYDLTLPGFESHHKGLYAVAWPAEQFERLAFALQGSASLIDGFHKVILAYLAIVALTIAAVLGTYLYGLLRGLNADFDAVRRGRVDHLTAERYPVELRKAVVLFNEIIEDNEIALKNTRRIVAHVAHDVNNKLQAFTAGINAPAPDRSVLLRHVAAIKSQIDRYRQIAISSQAEHQVRRRHFDLVDFAHQLLELQGFDATNRHVLYRLIVDGDCLERIVGTRVEHQRDPERDWPRIMVHAQTGDLEIMLNNLLSNASRYGGGQVDLSLATDGACAVIDVDDDGLGVPETDRARVFEAGVMLNPDQRLPGTGYGLDIVKAMAVHSQGEVTILDAPIGGARFRLTLPILDGDVAGRR